MPFLLRVIEVVCGGLVGVVVVVGVVIVVVVVVVVVDVVVVDAVVAEWEKRQLTELAAPAKNNTYSSYLFSISFCLNAVSKRPIHICMYVVCFVQF
jgi:hypothetical protein